MLNLGASASSVAKFISVKTVTTLMSKTSPDASVPLKQPTSTLWQNNARSLNSYSSCSAPGGSVVAYRRSYESMKLSAAGLESYAHNHPVIIDSGCLH